MNFAGIFYSLEIPETSNGDLFNAITLPEFPFAKIAVNNERFPVILISSITAPTFHSQKNVRLKYLELTHNLQCKVSEKGKTHFQNFTVIVFRSNQENLQHYFLGIAETLVKSLSVKPTQQEVFHTFKNLIEIFSVLSYMPTNTVQGLWGELFLINNSKDPKVLLNYWHNSYEERFDFNSGAEKIEVKSNSNYLRIHTFSSEQLNPKEGTQALIASIFVRQSNTGQSIQHLINSIIDKINNDIELTDKLNTLVCKILGNSLEQAIEIKFDYQIAIDSLRFYKHQDISKIEEIHIPTEVTGVKYKSDLSDVKAVSPQEISSLILFNSL